MDSLRQEKVYVHMDKPFYLVGDTIWMKGYLVDTRTHRNRKIFQKERYRLRAYTNLMRNADESFFIRDSLLSIRIRNPCLC